MLYDKLKPEYKNILDDCESLDFTASLSLIKNTLKSKEYFRDLSQGTLFDMCTFLLPLNEFANIHFTDLRDQFFED